MSLYLWASLLLVGLFSLVPGVYNLLASRFAPSATTDMSMLAQLGSLRASLGLFVVGAALSADPGTLRLGAAVAIVSMCVLQQVANVLHIGDKTVQEMCGLQVAGLILILGMGFDAGFTMAAVTGSHAVAVSFVSFLIGLVLLVSVAVVRCRNAGRNSISNDYGAPFVTIESHHQLSPASRALLSAK